MVVTPTQAREMRTAIELENQKDAQTANTQRQADIATALSWFNTLGINIQAATTRTQALANFNQIKALLQTETQRFRRNVLSQKLADADKKYKTVKKVNPNS